MQKHRSRGFTLLEVLVVIAIIGILAGLVVTSFPRDRFAMNQATQIASQAVQMARFEAVKRDTNVEITFTGGSPTIQVTRVDTGVVLRTYALDSQGSLITPSASVSFAFSPRGVAAYPSNKTVTLTYAPTSLTKTLVIHPQGSVDIQ